MSEEDVLRRAVAYAAAYAERRWDFSGTRAPLTTLAAIAEGVGKLAYVATESHRIEDSRDEMGRLIGGELFEQACQGAAIVMMEVITLLHMWGIDGRIVVKAFLDHEVNMASKRTGKRTGAQYLQLVRGGDN